MLDAIVIGTGVMGASALASLAEAGARVIGLDRFTPPHDRGSSHGETRVTRKAYFEDARYVPLLERCFVRYRELEARVGRPLFEPTRGLFVGPTGHEAVDAVRRAAEQHGLPYDALSAREVAARTSFVPADGDEAIVEHEAGVLAAEPMVGAFLSVAREHGAELASNEPALAIDATDGGVEVRTASRTWRAARLVVAIGGWAEEGSLLPPPCPLVVERQVQCWLEPRDPAAFTPDRLPIFIRFDGTRAFYGIPRVPRFGGLSARAVKVCAHHGGVTTSAEALDRAVSAEDEAVVRAFCDAHLPGLDAIVERRVCMYTNSPDEHFVIGPHPSVPRTCVLTGFSGHGFKLAPVVGEIARDVVLERAAPPALFDPRRFA
ncbi:MAG: N-methyl-L-tryptophan oxidase [Sandaracinaceae bacterium]